MSQSKKSKAKETKQKMKKMKKPPVAPQRPRNVKLMSSEELGLTLGAECGRIIQAQGVIQEAQTNVNNLNAELQLRQKAKESENDGEKE